MPRVRAKLWFDCTAAILNVRRIILCTLISIITQLAITAQLRNRSVNCTQTLSAAQHKKQALLAILLRHKQNNCRRHQAI